MALSAFFFKTTSLLPPVVFTFLSQDVKWFKTSFFTYFRNLGKKTTVAKFFWRRIFPNNIIIDQGKREIDWTVDWFSLKNGIQQKIAYELLDKRKHRISAVERQSADVSVAIYKHWVGGESFLFLYFYKKQISQ
jgi:hypothetical protein